MKGTLFKKYLTKDKKPLQIHTLVCLFVLIFAFLTSGTYADEDSNIKNDDVRNESEKSDGASDTKDGSSSAHTTQKNLARIVAILRFEARLAAQQVAVEQIIAEHEAGILSTEAAKKRAKERYDEQIATSEIVKNRAKEYYDDEIAKSETVKKRAEEYYDGEVAKSETVKNRAKEYYDGEIAKSETVKKRAKEQYEDALAGGDAAKKRAMAWIENANKFDENALKVAVFGAIDSNSDSELSQDEFEIGIQILNTLRHEEYPGMKKVHSAKTESVDQTEESGSFATLDSDDDGVLSEKEFEAIVDSFF